MLFLSALLSCVLGAVSLVSAADTAAWKSRSIYFVLTDRIARSSSDTGGSACTNLGDYCGGTFQGLEAKLDYIQGLGFDSIWITPVVANSAGGYHGYWAQDLYSINSNYGSASDLSSLVSAAHARGMYIMVDVVANHMGQGAIADNKPSPLNLDTSYHTPCDIDYNNQTSIENCRIAGLPDVYTQSSELKTVYQTWISWLVKQYSFDGVRIDTVKHVQKDFWPDFASAAGVYTIGEVFDGDPAYLQPYASLMSGLLNYAVYYPLNRFYQQTGSAQDLVDMMNTISNTFPDPSALGTFLDNHDNPRWLNAKNDQTLLTNALAYVMLARGIPILYYGTEQGYSGGADPANREDLWRSGFNTNTNLYQSIKKLAAARKAAGGLAANDHTHLYVASTAYAWSRAAGNLIVMTTNAGSSSNARVCFNTQVPNGRWTDVFSSSSSSSNVITSDGSSQACLTFTNGNPIVLLASASSAPTTLATLTTTTTTTLAAPTPCPSTLAITFSARVTTQLGDTIKLVGNTTLLADWIPSRAPALDASSSYSPANPVWSITLDIPAAETLLYKYVRVASSGAVTWEADPNRMYTVPSCGVSASVADTWQ
ncbi:hypothetical protein ACEQ8H_007243 [Pleosporales sp. CAS-2024a]